MTPMLTLTHVRVRAGRAILAAALLGLTLTACTTPRLANGKPDLAAPAPDPNEKFNRKIFAFNMFLDRNVLKPEAKAYRRILPNWTRSCVRNFLDYLHTPVILANDVLQGEAKRGAVTLGRFGYNSLLGPAGLRDAAKHDLGWHKHDEDFGQTLAVWGFTGGPYMMLPLVGPTNPRDLSGRIIDFAFDPATWVQWGKLWWVNPTRGLVDIVDERSRNLDTLDEIEKTSIDFYASIKSLHEQNRLSEIRNGKINPGDLPDF